MFITRVVLKNYRCLRNSNIKLNPELNVIVGDNECGKSTLLEAIYLGLSGQLNGKFITSELDPHLFNADAVREYVASLATLTPSKPPSIEIELYFADDARLAILKGANNSRKEGVPGVKMVILFDSSYAPEYEIYVRDPVKVTTVPVEYYKVDWRGFNGNSITARSIPIEPSFIDASAIRHTFAANRYVADIVKNTLSEKQQVDLALSYRLMKDRFSADDTVRAINDHLDSKRGEISDKSLRVTLDTSARSGWENAIMLHLNNIPMPLVGKGEQSSVKIKLALDSSRDCHIFLLEEAESHLAYATLNSLIKHIADRRGERQLLITTHSSFVLNKLGVDSVLLFSRGLIATLNDLDKETKSYFLRLPGYDTLRLILTKRAILVEGPSDELITQRAYQMKYGKLPLEDGVDVITVGSLAFPRFLKIAELLKITVDVITDNDGDPGKLVGKYAEYHGDDKISIHFDSNPELPTLEDHLLEKNGLMRVNDILGRNFSDNGKLLQHMKSRKTETALRFFETQIPWEPPEYIARAIG